MKKFINHLKFSSSGVRGIVGDGLTPKLLTNLAAAFGQYIGGGKVVIGRDTRASGAMFENAVSAGLLSVGCQVIRLGIVPTPTIQIMTDALHAKGGIAITASHNPENFNALKFIDSSGCFLDSMMADELFDLYSQGDFAFVPENRLRDIEDYPDSFAIHTRKILEAGIDVEAIRKAKFRVAVDCCNGVGALYSVPFLENLGCEVFAINTTHDGHFHRTPEPVPEALEELSETIRTHHCAIGFAQDPDGDRLTLADNHGKILSQHLTIALAAEHVLGNSDTAAVVVNLQTSKAIEEIARSYGCETVYSKVGEINVVEAMRKHHAEIGGEGNCGGVIWSKVHYGRDSFIAMALLLEMLTVNTETLADIVESLPTYHNMNTRFQASALTARNVIEELTRRYQAYPEITFDGLRIDFATGWILIRSSNTERILRLNVESKTREAAEELLQKFTLEIETLIGENAS